jgi:hypothetical protein
MIASAGKPQTGRRDELSLVKLYMDLTGTGQSFAQGVLMHVERCGNGGEGSGPGTQSALSAHPPQPAPSEPHEWLPAAWVGMYCLSNSSGHWLPV